MSARFRLRCALERLRYRVIGVPLACPHLVDNTSRRSPHETLSFTVGDRSALLCYGRPSADGRPVFGALVPYGELWRTGADEPTTLHLPFPASVAGLPLPRGRFALYTVPQPDAWTLVLNRSTRQSGRTREERGARGNVFPSAYTDAVRSMEVGRVPVETRTIDPVERLTARAEVVGPERTLLLIEWERTQVCIPLVAGTD